MPDNEMKPRPAITEVISQITPSIIAHHRSIGDLGGWCERTRAALSAWNARVPAQSAGGGEITDEIFLFEVGSAYRRGVEFGPYDDPHSIEPDASEYAALRLKDAREGKSILARAVLTDTAREGETAAAHDVLAERARQISEEGWTPEHDDRHWDGGLAGAAAAYAVAGSYDDHARRMFLGEWYSGEFTQVRELWPRDWSWFKPKDRRRDLVKAGALILAEIERLDRLAAPSNVGTGEGA